ncbi:hypothetical protein A7C99_3407 [Trichophyton rubrum]|uniref:NTF2 domain-containing protein n=1 Tax=Trichophyton rubrum TaxID=5551 RepID=A0A178F208_TRIRU|nr:hypothetical protein A7C99_3407 [Trichophyton rubrum]
MTAAIQEDILTKVSTDATTNFVQSYYSALDNARSTLSTFYAPTVTNLLFNGNIVADGASVQDIFVNQLPPTHYEVQSYDCQVLNPNYPMIPPATADNVASPFGANANRNTSDPVKNMSILVIGSDNHLDALYHLPDSTAKLAIKPLGIFKGLLSGTTLRYGAREDIPSIAKIRTSIPLV